MKKILEENSTGLVLKIYMSKCAVVQIKISNNNVIKNEFDDIDIFL